MVHDANGERDIFFAKVHATPGQIENGCHYDAVQEYFETNYGADVAFVFDETDRCSPLLEHAEWETMSTIDISNSEK